MTDFRGIVRELIEHNLGEGRMTEMCKQFGLSVADEQLVGELLSKWKPDYTVEDIVAIAENYKDRPNIGRVMQVCEVIAPKWLRLASCADGVRTISGERSRMTYGEVGFTLIVPVS